AARALAMATLDAARALGLHDETGSLDVGKAADLAAFSLDDLRAWPAFEPEGTLIFALSGRPALLVTVAGRELVRQGALVHDVTGDRDLVARAAQELSAASVDG